MALIKNGILTVQGVQMPFYKTSNGLLLHTQWSTFDNKEVFIDLIKPRQNFPLLNLKIATHEHSVEELWTLENGLPAFKCRLSQSRITIFGEIDLERGRLALEFGGCEISHDQLCGFVFLATNTAAGRTKDARAVRVRASHKLKSDAARHLYMQDYYPA